MILNIINNYSFIYWNGDRALANSINIQHLRPLSFLWCFIYDPKQWDMENFEDWKQIGQPICFVEHTASFAGTATRAPEIIPNKDVSSNLNVVAAYLFDNDLTITKTGVVSEKDANSNLNAAADDDIDNKNPHPKCKNLIGDLDNI